MKNNYDIKWLEWVHATLVSRDNERLKLLEDQIKEMIRWGRRLQTIHENQVKNRVCNSSLGPSLTDNSRIDEPTKDEINEIERDFENIVS